MLTNLNGFSFYTDNPSLEAWLGAKKWALDADQMSNGFITKADYEEKGSEYLKEHGASNLYVPSPSSR